MNSWQAVVLGAVQGFTEFLPISSSGHLVLAEALLGVRVPGVFVEVSLHTATLLAVLIVYRRRIGELVRGAVTGDSGSWRYLGLLAVATLPAGVAGVLFREYFERTFHSLASLGVQFVITGLILWSTRFSRRVPPRSQPGIGAALGMGVAQAIAIIPAISRSGTTLAAALWAGIDPARAGEFSFLMSIPVIGGAALLEVPKLARDAEAVGAGPLGLSFLVAMVSGVVAIRWLLVVLQRGRFYRFAPYCVVLGAATMVWAGVRP